MPQPSWCRNLTKRATVSIDVLFINTISDAVHSCTCHDVPGRALNRLVINRTSTSATDKMCGGRFIPFTGRIVHFIASNPHTGLALASVPIRCVGWL
uniref:Shufflon-specific DNA recombinase n=1 Tax=Escherichia coli TaxID=562 RepID=A0A6D1NXH8_ECOLX|nr:Shufflon-specific DNA recombinase [Escherichia coli]